MYAPDRATLERRWELFVAADEADKREMFGEARDRNLHTTVGSLPGIQDRGAVPLAQERRGMLDPVRVGYRAFDRQWLIPDNRLMVVPRPDLWRVRGASQLFVVEQNAHAITNGPGLVFSAFIPDMHYFNGRSGAVRPLYRDAAGQTANVTPELLPVVSQRLGVSVSAQELIAYIAAVTSHPAYTEQFVEDLEMPGARIPFTAAPELWDRAVEIGRRVLWLHTFGERFADASAGRHGAPPSPRLPAERRPVSLVAIPDTTDGMPTSMRYDEASKQLWIGAGCVGPVEPEVRRYSVSGMNVLDKWFGYRRKEPAGKRLRSLDHECSPTWLPDWTSELLELLNVLACWWNLSQSSANCWTKSARDRALR